MNAVAELAGEPEPNRELLERLAREVSIEAFCELVAAMFRLGPGSGEQTVEMSFVNGEFRWARIQSGRIGRDQLDRLRSNGG